MRFLVDFTPIGTKSNFGGIATTITKVDTQTFVVMMYLLLNNEVRVTSMLDFMDQSLIVLLGQEKK